jgi:hypothetical protein
MKKIKLDVGALHVDSFEAGPKPAAGGTVLGYATRNFTCADTCQPPTGVTNCDCTLGCNTVPCTTS